MLSTGEQFRVTLARTLAESVEGRVIAMDEFTSVVDRQVAKIGAHAAQKWVRKHDRQFVAATCHYDVEEWLQPDWVLEPATMTFTWRCLQPRPALSCAIARVPYDFWHLFAPFHYLTRELNKAARCYVLFAGDDLAPAAFAGVLHRPVGGRQGNKKLKGLSRLVTLPDWQGLGLAFVLADAVAGAYGALEFDFHSYPAHPALIRAFDRSDKWELRKAPGKLVSPKTSRLPHTRHNAGDSLGWGSTQGMRPCAVFRYRGPKLEKTEAERLVGNAAAEAKIAAAARPRKRPSTARR